MPYLTAAHDPDSIEAGRLSDAHDAAIDQQFDDVEASQDAFEKAVREVIIDTANMNGDYFWEIMRDFEHLQIDADRLARSDAFKRACADMARAVIDSVVEAR